MSPLSFFTVPSALQLPFIPLGIPVGQGLTALQATGASVVEERDDEHLFRAQLDGGAIAIYVIDAVVRSVWCDDYRGRLSTQGKRRKVELHLSRYGALQDWHVWRETAWMRYWRNDAAAVRMVYGIHMDVLRFNDATPTDSGQTT